MLPSHLIRFFPFLSLGMRALVRVMAPRYRVSGRHNIPFRGPVIFASTHVSDADPPFLGSALRFPVAWMAKRELWEMGNLGKILDFFGCFPVDPASPDRAALKMSFQTLEDGNGLVIFPEGQLSPTGAIGPILPGAILIALKSGVPVVPVGIWGSQFVVPHGSTTPRATLRRVHVHFGPPLDFKDLENEPSKRGRELARRRLEAAMHAASAVARSS